VPGEAARIRFVLSSVTVAGSTVYDSAALAATYSEFVGKEISLADAQTIADRITVKYRNDGYILSRAVVPAQRISGGALRVQVVEGYIKDFRIDLPSGVGFETNSPFSGIKSKLAAYAQKIVGAKPVTNAVMERYLLLANDLPGVTAQAVLAPATGAEPGAATLVVSAQRKPIDIFVSADNHGSRFSGPYQGQVGMLANSLLGLSEVISVRAINTIGDWDEMSYLEGNWDQDIGNEGTKFGFGVSYSKTEPGYTLEPFNIEGKAVTATVRVQHPIIRSRTMNWYVRGTGIYRDVENENGLAAIETNDHIWVARLGTTFDFVDRFSGVTLIDVELSKGLPIFNYTKKGELSSRPEGTGNFFKANAQISRLQSLFVPGLSLFLAAQGQISADKLLSSEEFGVGGAQWGRAFDPGEITGDHGIAAKAELQYGGALNFFILRGYQFFAFFDYGKIWNDDKADKTAGTDKETIKSAGAGVRLNFLDMVSGELFVAKALGDREIANRGSHGDDWRGFFSLTARF
jgi:hemolysin activation/secretion protein